MQRRTFTKHLLASLALPLIPASTLAMETESNQLSLGLGGGKNKVPRKLIKPQHLQPGDRIALVAPGSPIDDEQLQIAKANLESLDLKVVHTQNIRARKGYLAGTDQQRAADINRFFEDPSIAGIWCIRGGYGSARILPMLDYKMIRKNPKVFIGYSDVTAIHQALVRHAKLMCFHGPVAGINWSDFTRQHLMVLINSTESFSIRPARDKAGEEGNTLSDSYTLQSGTTKGQLVGGNLSIICSLLGTPYALDFSNKIVFLEDIGEKPYRIDRMLTQLLLEGGLAKAAGIAIGICKRCDSIDVDTSLTLSQTLQDRLFDLGIPVAYGLPFGHVRNNCTLPVGAQATFDATNRVITLNEKVVK